MTKKNRLLKIDHIQGNEISNTNLICSNLIISHMAIAFAQCFEKKEEEMLLKQLLLILCVFGMPSRVG